MVKNCVSHISILGREHREEKNFFVILDIIYWFIIITENETRSRKAFYKVSAWGYAGLLFYA